MKRLLTIFIMLVASMAIAQQGERTPPVGYGGSQMAVFQQRVIDSSGTYVNNIGAHELDNYYSDTINPTLFNVPAGWKTSRLFSAKPTDGSGDFTCVRASTVVRIDENGDSDTVAVNTPVIDFSTGIPLLIVSEVGELTVTTPTTATKVIINVDGVDVEYFDIFPTLTLPVGSIKSIMATDAGGTYDLLKAYLLRVDTATGTTSEDGASDLKVMYDYLVGDSLLDSTKLLYLSNAGMIQRVDGVLKYVRTAYDASENDNDLDGSATASQQPRLVGGIAPNSKPAASNQNGEARYFTHPAITFAATDAWSVSIMFDWNYGDGWNVLFGSDVGSSIIDINSLIRGIRFTNSLGSTATISNTNTLNHILGKKIVLTFTTNGLGNITSYINGVQFSTNNSVVTSFIFKYLKSGGTLTSTRCFQGSISAYHIQSGAMSAAQVLAEYNLLRGMYPEIESTTIGSQTWATRNFEAVATPMGNVIANVTENGAVEKIPQPLDLTTGFNLANPSSTIVDANTFSTTAVGGVTKTAMVNGKYFKIKLAGTISDGNLSLKDGAVTTTYISGLSGTFSTEVVIKWVSSNPNALLITNVAATVDLTEYSIQELNWSNATEIYDAVYAATAGTTAEKEYAALKEAAAWAYHTNSVDLGATYSKIYNGYGKDLLVDDIASSTGWGYHVATEAELTALAALGGLTLKYVGDDYWTTDNGTNTTGLTALGGASRDTDGTFNTIKESVSYWCADSDKVLTILDDGTATIEAKDKLFGAYVRLVKD